MSPEVLPEELLRQTPLLRSLDRRLQDEIVARVEFRAFNDGDRLVEAGTPGRSILLMLRGQAEVWAREGQRRLRVASMEPGALVGEMTFFSPDMPRTADVVGRGSGMLAILTVELYEGLCRTDPAAASALEKAVLTLLADRLEETNRVMAHLMENYRASGLTAALEWLGRLLRGKP